MNPSPLDAVRINSSTWAWQSCAFAIDGQSTEGVVAIDYDEQLELRIIPSNIQDQSPLGMSLGRYQVGRFPIRMLRDSAKALKTYLAAKALAQGIPSGSYGQATFDLGLQLSGTDAPDATPSSTVFASCRIVGEAATHEEGTGVAVTEFQVASLAIVQDGLALFDAAGSSSTELPGADSITCGGVLAPGKWTLMRGERVYGWDVRKGTALSGATVVPTGDELVEAEFLVEIWTVADYIAYKLFRSQYLKKALVATPGSPIAMALGIDHPELKELGATSFVVRSSPALLNDGFGVWGGTVKFLEYRKPLPALSKPDAAIPDVSTPRPTAQTQTEIELQKAQAQLQALGGT